MKDATLSVDRNVAQFVHEPIETEAVDASHVKSLKRTNYNKSCRQRCVEVEFTP